ncbi:hypothetical protein CASFOL_042206 [Castilleja foliolosa]|uniref:Uncharacterized protein n=1 Tax=Castilleja foliolosa TaxID=1961234 RepID=A0ABD3BB69_9LAMI
MFVVSPSNHFSHVLRHHWAPGAAPGPWGSSRVAWCVTRSSNQASAVNPINNVLSAADPQTFDSTRQVRTNNVINALATGVEVRALSFDSLRGITECLLDMNQEVVKVILDCKKDIRKNKDLFELVEEYFKNSLTTLEFCTALEKCLKSARDSQLLIHVALQQFEKDDHGVEGHFRKRKHRYTKTLEELKSFKNAGDPFTEDFFVILQSIYKQQMLMLEKLQSKKHKLDKKLKRIRSWRKVSSIIFTATLAAVLICSVVAAAVAAPPVAAALAAAVSIPIGWMGKWIDSLLKKCKNDVKGQKEVINCLSVGTCVTIKDLDNIRVSVDKLETEIESLLRSADFGADEGRVKLAVREIKKKMVVFTKNIDELEAQADKCSRDIRRDRNVILQRIIKHPNRQ